MSDKKSEVTREEFEGMLMLLVSDIREARDNGQKHLNEPNIAFSEMLVTVGKVKALRDVLEVVGRIAALYKLDI